MWADRQVALVLWLVRTAARKTVSESTGISGLYLCVVYYVVICFLKIETFFSNCGLMCSFCRAAADN